ncbi:MAG: glycosyltransferase family 1 protein [Kiritimatiellae bacterium]|nr:glycosyltransferase family 1 protein [Kiritimatiellia bacterium]
MRIGVMLRTMDEKQGIGVYTQNLMDRLLALDEVNEYVLFYRNPAFIGRYAELPRVTEKLVSAPNKWLWDQCAIPLEARKEGCDLIFHTKFTVPFLTSCKTVMSIHGASWFVHPELYDNKLDLTYIKTIMPRYCHKADAIVANSELTRQDYIRLFNLPPDKVTVAHLGHSDQYRVIEETETLEAVREKYGLPECFILAVVKYDPRKNFENLIAAFRLLRKRMPCKLVVAGRGCEKYREECRMEEDGIAEDVLFTGWVEQAELPAMYNLARCMFFPSVYEEFGIPTCEAMACGCPPVVSSTGALPEIAGEAGLIADPFNPAEMADALEKLYTDDACRAEQSARCLERAKQFTWENCARRTLDVLNRA